MMPKHIDLSHDITAGMLTYPGLPTPEVTDHLSREAAEEIYGPGLTFQIGLVTMCTNTGTYLDVPFHRYADGHDLTGLALERVASVDAICLDQAGVGADRHLADVDLSDAAGRGGVDQDGACTTLGGPMGTSPITRSSPRALPSDWWPPRSHVWVSIH